MHEEVGDDAVHGVEQQPSSVGVRGTIAAHPLASAAFAGCVILGAVLAYSFLGEDFSVIRRIVGGALLGGLGWLLVMVGRLF